MVRQDVSDICTSERILTPVRVRAPPDCKSIAQKSLIWSYVYRARVLSHWPLVLAAERGFYVQLPANTSRMQSPTQVKIVLALFDEVAPCTGTRTRICACAYVIRSRTPDYFQLCSVTNPDAEPTGNVHRPHDTRSWRESLHVAAHE